MEDVRAAFIMFTILPVLDFVNLFLVYDKFKLVERKPVKKGRFLYFTLMFFISYMYGMVYTDIVISKITAVCIYIPFFFKVLPVLWLYFPKRKKDIFTVIFYNLIIITITQGIYFTLNKDLERDYGMFIYYLCKVSATIVVSIILFLIFLISRNKKVKIYFGDLTVRHYIIFGVVLIISNLIGVEVLILYPDNMPMEILSLLNVIMVYILMRRILIVRESETRRGKIIDILDRQMENMTGYYNRLVELEVQTKKFRHDIKNHLIVLHSMVEQGENEKAIKYIEKMDNICKKISREYDTGNFIADTLLSAKAAEAADINTKISFNGYIPADNLENVDLVVLLSNIMDNAIEACEKKDGEKTISIESVLDKKMWVICVKNPVKDDVKIEKNRILTTKSNRELHGYGLQNMERTVNKYNGNLKFECRDGIFSVRAMLMLEEKGADKGMICQKTE